MSKLSNKIITLNYLNNNNIKYIKLFNIIISLPTKSIHNDNLICQYTKLYTINNITILIHKY
jgi:hypothetical protein